MIITKVSSWDRSRKQPTTAIEREIGRCLPDKRHIRKHLTIDGITVASEPGFEVGNDLSWEVADVTLSQLASLIELHGLQAFTLGRRKRDGSGRKDGSDFEAVPQDVFSLDIDGMPFIDGFTREDLVSDPERVIRAQVGALLGSLASVEWLVVLSSSCSFIAKGRPVLRFHLHIALDREYRPAVLERMTKALQGRFDFVDPATTSPSQYLLTSRPVLNVPDPFPRRVFLNLSPERLPLNAKGEHYVSSTLHASRGRSSSLYRISKDRFAAGEWVSEELRNFTLSLRNRFPKMEWPEALPYVERAMREAGGTELHFARMSNRSKPDPYLWEARRLFDGAPIAGEKSIHAEAAYVEPEGSADIAYARLENAVNEAVATGGQHLFRVSVGTGKTELIARFAADNPHLKVVVLTTNHERCAEMRDRLERARDEAMDKLGWESWPTMDEQRESNLFKSWDVWEGRLHDDACKRPDAVRAVQRAHLSVHKDLCGYGEDVQCPFMGKCRHSNKMLRI